MKFTKKNIQKSNRNGVLIVNSANSTSTINYSNTQTNNIGNYLPATSNGDGTYTVNLDKVFFNGNISANGEVTAYKQGTDGEISGGDKVIVYDGLDSTDTSIALSANQGRILKGLIDNKADGGGTSVDLTNYYDKTTTDSKLNLKADKSWVTSTYQPKGNYLTSIPSEYITETELTNKGYLTSSSLNGYAKTSQIPTKVSQLTNDKNYLTSHQSITHLANKDGSNVSGTWGISITGTANNSNNLGNKPASQYVTTDTNQSITANKDFSGYVKIKGTAAERHLITRGIGGLNDATDTPDDLYINYGTNYGLRFGNGGQGYLKGDGSINASSYSFGNSSAISFDGFGNVKFAKSTGSWNVFNNASTSLVCVHNNNNVGIGTTNPTQKLDVNGNIKSSGEIYAKNDKKVWHSGNFNPFEKVDKIGKQTIYTSDVKPYNFVHLFRIANKSTWSQTKVDIDFKSRNHAAKLFIDISTNDKCFGQGNSYIRISQLCTNDRTAEFYVKQTIQTKDYNYYDIYYKSGSWNMGSYNITNQGNNGTLVFEAFNKNIEALPQGTTKVIEKLKVNGNITATGDIIAYAVGDGDTSTNKGIVYDKLDSTDGTIALSANQGRILNNRITEVDGKFQPKNQFKTINNQSILGNGNIDIKGGSDMNPSNYYTKTDCNSIFMKKALNVRNIGSSTTIQPTDDVLVFTNGDKTSITITLSSSIPIGKILFCKETSGGAVNFSGGNLIKPTSRPGDYGNSFSGHAHTFMIIKINNNEWISFYGW